MLVFLMLFLGVGLLSVGGEVLIRGSLAAATRFGVTPLFSGLVIVGFGTSAPELAVSIDAAVNGRPDIALGNVVGSNIGNVFLILGICALITPLAVRPLALRRDALAVVAASILFLVLVDGSELQHVDAIVLLCALMAYLVWAYVTERDGVTPPAELHKAEAEALSVVPKSLLWIVIAIGLGLLLLVSGSQVLQKGAVGIAERFGVSEAVIGLTLVAVGTSLPELSISVIAAIRRQGDIAVGNVLGSNIFNLLGILGVSALLQPLPVHGRILQFDQWVMIGSAVLLSLFLYSSRCVSRLEGGLLLFGYGIYIGLTFTVFGG